MKYLKGNIKTVRHKRQDKDLEKELENRQKIDQYSS